jgi:hypothetical protein
MQPLAVARRTKWRPPLDQILGGGGGHCDLLGRGRGGVARESKRG